MKNMYKFRFDYLKSAVIVNSKQNLTKPYYKTLLLQIIFTDVINKAIVTSDDKGKTFKVKQLNFSPSDLSFYEADPRTFIILDREDTKRTVEYI